MNLKPVLWRAAGPLLVRVAILSGLRRDRLALVLAHRAVVGLALVTAVGAAYFAVLALARPLTSSAGLVAALVAGVVFHPARVRLQGAADRLFGVERDPYRLADRIDRHVQEAPGPAEALASAAAAVRRALRAPGVAVEVTLPGGRARTVADGETGEALSAVPLEWQGTSVGRLLVAGRPGDPALLDMLARRLAELAHAVRLTAELRRSRERLLLTREEERHELRRSLHDDLGPTLAELARSADEARRSLAGGPEAVDPLLTRMRGRMTEAVVDVRELVYGLRPPARDGAHLGEPGLERALRTLTARRPAPRAGAGMTADGSGRARRAVVALVWALALAAPVAMVITSVLGSRLDSWNEIDGFPDPVGLLFPAAGAFLITHRPRLLFPWLLWGTGVLWSCYLLLFAVTAWTHTYDPGPLTPYLAWPSLWLWLWVVPTFSGIMPLLFPDGRLPSRRWRPVLHGHLVLMTGHSLLLALAPDPEFELGLRIENPFGVPALGTVPEVVESWIGVPIVLLSLLGVASLGVRYRAATPEVRRQIAWYLWAMVIFVGYWAGSQGSTDPVVIGLRVFLTAGIPIAVVASALRHRLYGIRLILNRTLVYGTLAVGVAVTYPALIWAADSVAGDYGSLAGLAAALATAAVFHPVRLRLQRSVDRLFNVERDPYRAADLLSRTVQRAGDPAAALAEALSIVRAGLGARGAAVEVRGVPATSRSLSFADGEPGSRPFVVDLVWHGEPTGRLLLTGGPRTRWSRRGLTVMAKHLAELAHAVRLDADLRDSLDRITATRDEERRRLGRELHDGLGPTLTSVTLTLDEARRRLARDPGAVDELLIRVREEMTATLESVRELVDGLRPPVLEELGLPGALRALAHATPGPRVEVRTQNVPAGLPAAVETAAYRIAQEALTNARRHAHATTILIALSRQDDGTLRVTIADDGIGLPGEPSPGVGLTSMRERAAEIGGTCAVTSSPSGGTEVTAVLPL
ncbi:histidine kinase [Actinomadura sp. ATCC 31491]|uniref:Oxygen sensor histidine kinase NreB n=1 Tax=Actinomadura luzonensis TaxID=2805427 RepID=A0ABT0FP91_9ACTN|nr:histidine kinase [Actinomadura luzonensis]MCK2214079.1 histidine kinase [Actinomadura luzonensis]